MQPGAIASPSTIIARVLAISRTGSRVVAEGDRVCWRRALAPPLSSSAARREDRRSGAGGMETVVLASHKVGNKHTSVEVGKLHTSSNEDAKEELISPKHVDQDDQIGTLARREQLAFAAKVRAARAALGWTQSELGSRVPLTQTSIYKMEQGTHGIRRSTVEKVEQVLKAEGIEFEDLPGGGFKLVVPERILATLQRNR